MESAFILVKERLLNIIREQKFENNKLNSEEELFKMLDASRGTVREVLRSLAREGVITKKHGIGNFVHPRTTDMKMRIDEIEDFIQLIEDGGYQASMEKDGEPYFFSIQDGGSGEKFESYLEKDLVYYCFNRLYLADRHPAAYSQLFFPKHLFVNFPSGEVEHKNIFDFVKTYFNQEIDQTLIWLNAESADQNISTKLNISSGTALLVWDELLCNYKDQIIGYSRIHFNPAIMKVSMLRKS